MDAKGMYVHSIVDDQDGAITTDWVVLSAAILGLGVAVLSAIGTGSLDLADETSRALSNTNVASTSEPVESDGDTNFFPWIARSERDDAGFWAYNDQNQLIDPDTGELLSILASADEQGNILSYYNARGEAVDANGVLLN